MKLQKRIYLSDRKKHIKSYPKQPWIVSDSYFHPTCQTNSDPYQEPTQELSLSFGKRRAAPSQGAVTERMVSLKPPNCIVGRVCLVTHHSHRENAYHMLA